MLINMLRQKFCLNSQCQPVLHTFINNNHFILFILDLVEISQKYSDDGLKIN